ncbi:MAG: SCO family protein [Gammaproteobacteria bacterium]|nr:SCO family protein [Gammaproteobacteria bacterium]MCW8909254.1 SCO family protein [Gammaproteobacteria bacterium]MCW9005608.1 SCO family protein [Gammaproteobacteria bacterium]MCW9056399.1 SCO family protein [Gammaproteobacteria bacterium]
MSRKNTTLHKIHIILLVSILAGISAILISPSQVDIPSDLLAVVRSNPVSLKPFSLVNQHNQAFTLDQLKDRQSLVFFGYTSCPDVCPATLSTLNIFYKLLGEKQATDNLQIIFVSVDPQRDSIEKLADYMNYFNNEFIALTGSDDEINKLARQFGAAYFIEQGASDENYLISHASSIFLVDQNSKLIAAFSPPHNPEVLSNQYLSMRDVFNFN